MREQKFWVLGLTTFTLLGGLAGCSPIPSRQLNEEEKIADMYWIYSTFGENYAPLDMKQKLYQFDIAKLKADYLQAAKLTKSNNEFYDLMYKFVAEFRDAHTTAALTNSSFEGDAQIAYLGFSGYRNDSVLIVKSLLPTISADSAYPIKVGDKIKKIDGKDLKTYINDELIQHRNLGNAEANYTYHMNKIFTRVSTANGLPQAKDAVLTIERDKLDITVSLPWVFKDAVKFEEEQKAATSKKETLAKASSQFQFSFVGFDGRMQSPLDLLNKIEAFTRKKFSDGFQFVDNISTWNVLAAADSATDEAVKSPLDKLARVREVLDDAIEVPGAKTYLSYIAPRAVIDKDGKKTEDTKLVGYIYLDTFSPDGKEEDVLAEVKQTLRSFKTYGVKDIVIDTINNGGGSLELGMKLSQALTSESIEVPKMQFRLSDSWLGQFRKQAKDSNSDAEAEYARRIYEEMFAAKAKGERLSAAYPGSVLSPFAIQPNRDLIEGTGAKARAYKFNIVVLVNEMCASMCDIFAATLQDNKMATIMGTNSMGAGGNVVSYNQAPNSHLDLRQTESLLVRKDGTYLENAGVKPDVEVSVANYAKAKYGDVIEKAFDYLLKQK